MTMTYEEFKEEMPNMNDNFSSLWDMNQFKIECQKCKSRNCFIFIGHDLIGGEGGCETCGYGGEKDYKINLTVKCGNCGEAMVIQHES